jgi:hypothetical protein
MPRPARVLNSRKLRAPVEQAGHAFAGQQLALLLELVLLGGRFRHHLALQGLHLRQPFGHALVVAAEGVGARVDLGTDLRHGLSTSGGWARWKPSKGWER